MWKFQNLFLIYVNIFFNMKQINTYINEKLKISTNQKNVEHTLFPETKEELQQMIKDEMSKNGNRCSLNHIDVSNITDMSELFYRSSFNGDISEWDVSNVTDMREMFERSAFNKDISNWDVSNVKIMGYMFRYSKFNKDISNWDVSNVTNMSSMFSGSNFNGDISNWVVSNVTNMDSMFYMCPLQNNPPKWYKE